MDVKHERKLKKEKNIARATRLLQRIDNNLSERSRVIEPVEGSGRRSATCTAPIGFEFLLLRVYVCSGFKNRDFLLIEQVLDHRLLLHLQKGLIQPVDQEKINYHERILCTKLLRNVSVL